jgi:hypothetical protein
MNPVDSSACEAAADLGYVCGESISQRPGIQRRR